MSNTPELLPCPFCGGEAIKCGDNGINPRHWIMCSECHACPGGDVPEQAQAAAAWNRRAALQSAAGTPAPLAHVLPELPKLPPYSHSAFPHGFHELWTEKQMKQYARDTAAFWRNDVVEKAAQIAERYGVDPWIARDIRALAATATEDGR